MSAAVKSLSWPVSVRQLRMALIEVRVPIGRSMSACS